MADPRTALADLVRAAILADFAEHGAGVIARLEGKPGAEVIPIISAHRRQARD